jgi:hypothetical protein
MEIAKDPAVSRTYQTVDGHPPQPLLRLISPLAEGTDRLVAEEAVRLGFRLEVVLTFTQKDYETDFDPASRAEFEALLAQSGDRDGPPCVVALDGARGAAEDRSYEAAGRMVVRNCDLLIAIWDGEPAKGRGGIAEIVHFAQRMGPPVWWINADASDSGRWLYVTRRHTTPPPTAVGRPLRWLMANLKRLRRAPSSYTSAPHCVPRLHPARARAATAATLEGAWSACGAG